MSSLSQVRAIAPLLWRHGLVGRDLYDILQEKTAIKTISILLALGLAMALASACGGQPCALDAFVSQADLTALNGKTVTEITFLMGNVADVHVSAEYIGDSGASTERLNLGLALPQTAASVLDAATESDGRYSWMSTNGWLHMIPRNRPQDYLFDKPFAGPLPSSGGVLGKLQKIIAPCYGGKFSVVLMSLSGTGDKEPVMPTAVMPEPGRATIRDAVDAVVTESGHLSWSVFPPAIDSDYGLVPMTILISTGPVCFSIPETPRTLLRPSSR